MEVGTPLRLNSNDGKTTIVIINCSSCKNIVTSIIVFYQKKSKLKYYTTVYDQFIEWKKEKRAKSFSENLLMANFLDLRQTDFSWFHSINRWFILVSRCRNTELWATKDAYQEQCVWLRCADASVSALRFYFILKYRSSNVILLKLKQLNTWLFAVGSMIK